MNNYYLGLDISTKSIGISLFEVKDNEYDLKLLKHVTPKIKDKNISKTEELFKKVDVFKEEFLARYKDMGIKAVVIEEPLLRSNNVNTVGTLLRFNGMISKAVYDILGIVPEFISSYDARKYAFPQLMEVRKFNKKGEALSEKEISKAKPVLFGGYPVDVDKKRVIWDLVADLEPQIVWEYDKHMKLKKENFDTTDSYVVLLAYLKKNGYLS